MDEDECVVGPTPHQMVDDHHVIMFDFMYDVVIAKCCEDECVVGPTPHQILFM